MPVKMLRRIDLKDAAKFVRLIVPRNEPVLTGDGVDDYACSICKAVLIKGANPRELSAKPLVLICNCGTHNIAVPSP
jgi:hypothetical protein